LITFEKPDDWDDAGRVESARLEVERYGIVWKPQSFKSGPPVVAPALSMLRMVWLTWRAVRKGKAELIHARSYIPAAVALAVHKLTGVPFIFDMRALWPEELITAERLKRGSIIHRSIIWIERQCLQQASAIVSLTHAAVGHLYHEYPTEMQNQRTVVIPTCTDLRRFTPASFQLSDKIVYGCVGTVLSGWFRVSWLREFFLVAASRDPRAAFEVVTRDDVDTVRKILDPEDHLKGRLNIGPRSVEDMPDTLQGHSLTVMFYAGGETSELGRSPTRMAEVLACGLPVVANEGVGDVASIIRDYRVGVLVTGSTHDEMLAAWNELQALLADPDLKRRCRQAAEEVFSLEAGTAAYARLYDEILDAK